jgi:hypothetical protein
MVTLSKPGSGAGMRGEIGVTVMDRAKTIETKPKETEPPSRGAPAPQNGWKFSDWAAI